MCDSIAILWWIGNVQYIPRNMHTDFALLCFVVVIHWLIFPYPSGLLHWHCGNLTIAPVPAKQPWWIWINTSCEFIMNDCITTTKQSTTKPCAYFLGYTVDRLLSVPCLSTVDSTISQSFPKKYAEPFALGKLSTDVLGKVFDPTTNCKSRRSKLYRRGTKLRFQLLRTAFSW